MKQSHVHILQAFILSVFLTLGVIIWKQASFVSHKKPHSVFAIEQSKQHKQPKQSAVTSSPDLAAKRQVRRSIPLEPSPLSEPSAEELREFPGAIVLEASEIEGPEPGQKTRLRILITHFKYPNIRTEEIIDTTNNSVVIRQEMVADHFLVTLAPDETPETFLKKMGDQVSSMERVTENAPLYRVNLTQTASLEALPAAIAASAEATTGTGEPDFIVHACSEPNDPAYTNEWGCFQNYYSLSSFSFYYGIDAEDAWNIRTDASSVIVAVVDSGIRYIHEDLAANMWNNPEPTNGDLHGWNAYHNNGDPMDILGHGTMCAGIIGAVGNNGIGICGIAWKVQLMACQFLNDQNSGTQSDEVACIDYAINHGAKILNCSFGNIQPFCQNGIRAEKNALERACAAGLIVVCAAGNGNAHGIGMDNDTTPFYPANYPLDNIVSVAATDTDNTLASFSNYGAATVDLAAPGVGIYSTYGGTINNADFYWKDGTGDSAYAYMNGTSAAAPFVAGAFALLKAQFPNEPYNSLIARLLAATDKLPSLQSKTTSGRFLNIYAALTSPFTPLPSESTPTPWYEYDPDRTWNKWWHSL